MLRLAPWKVASILTVIVLAVLLVVPSFLGAGVADRLEKALPSFLPVRPIVLGLDLQGGASLLDFFNAESDYRTVELNYVNLVGSYLTAAAQLNQAVGREVIQ